MPTPRKYFAPCEVHAIYTSKCRHCAGWARLMHRRGGPQIPRAKNPGTTGKTWRMPRKWARRGNVRMRSGSAFWNGRLDLSWRPPALS